MQRVELHLEILIDIDDEAVTATSHTNTHTVQISSKYIVIPTTIFNNYYYPHCIHK